MFSVLFSTIDKFQILDIIDADSERKMVRCGSKIFWLS